MKDAWWTRVFHRYLLFKLNCHDIIEFDLTVFQPITPKFLSLTAFVQCKCGDWRLLGLLHWISEWSLGNLPIICVKEKTIDWIDRCFYYFDHNSTESYTVIYQIAHWMANAGTWRFTQNCLVVAQRGREQLYNWHCYW